MAFEREQKRDGGREREIQVDDVDRTAPARKGRRGRLVTGLLVAVAVIGVVAVWRPWGHLRSGSDFDGRGEGFNVLLITLDTTRADALRCYGNRLVQTPHIDALAEAGVRFAQCTAAAPITLPSHASIMTATYPFTHRARNNGRHLADEGNVTLAELLRDAGYTTGAEVAAYVLDAVWGLDQGFDSYRADKQARRSGTRLELAHGEQSVPADDVCDRAIEWLDRDGAEPFFLWVHFFDPHQPWRPPERFAAPYATEQFGAYLGEISFMDDQIGRLVAELRRKGLADRTFIVLTADHGEGLLEHQEMTHTYYVYDATTRVPLVLSCPGRIPTGRVVESQVRTVDVVPTILAFLGLPAKTDAQGRSLLPLLEDDAVNLDLAAYAESVSAHDAHGYSRLRAYRAGAWKYIHAPKPELYHVLTDPREKVNVIARHVEVAASLRDELRSLIAESLSSGADPRRAVQLDAAATARLAALGYVGGYTPPDSPDELASFDRFEGPDPKDYIGSYNRFLEALGWSDAEQPDKAVAILRELVTEQPQSPAIRSRLAFNLRRLSEFAEAAEHYQFLLELQPDNALAHYELGQVLGELGRTGEALEHLRSAAEAMPADPDSHKYLALALLKVQRLDEAEVEFRKTLELEPDDDGACAELGTVLYSRGRRQEALDLLRGCDRESPDNVKVANNLAWMLATSPEPQFRNGQEAVRVAEDLRRRITEEDPSVLDTLAAAYAESGRFDAAAATARKALSLLQSDEHDELAAEVKARLALYESGRAYHEGS